MDWIPIYQASVERLLNLFTRPCHDGLPAPVQPGGGGPLGARCGCAGNPPPHHFTPAEFGSRVLYKIYPRDYAKLCHRASNQALAAIVKDWMNLPDAPPTNAKLRQPQGGSKQVAYPVVGRVFVDNLDALVAAERDAVQTQAPAAAPNVAESAHHAVSVGNGDDQGGTDAAGHGISGSSDVASADAAEAQPSLLTALAAAYGFEEGSSESYCLRRVLAAAGFEGVAADALNTLARNPKIRRDAKEHGSYLEDQSELRQLRVDWLSTICHYYGLSPNAIDISSDELMRRCGQFDLDVEVPRYIDQYISRCESKGPDAVDAQYRCAAERARSARVTGDGEPNGSAVVGVPPGALAPAEVAAQGSQTPAERAKTSFLLAMAEPVPLATHRAWVSPWERDMPLPPRPYLGFDLECKLLASTDADAQSVQRRLEESVPDAFDVRVWRVHRQAHETKYKLEADRIGNEQLLWHSSSNTDPTELVFSGYPFDKTKSGGGSYGEGLYFSKHAIYGGRILPCRVSQLDVADGLRGELPQVGDDVMLVGRDRDLATYCIEGVTGDMFSIRKLRWDAHRKEAVEPKQIRLGDGRGDSTLWRFADRRYSILASVALGQCKDYGPHFKETLRGPPRGCNSVSGTELDLHIKQVVNRREWYPEWTADYEPLAKHGSKYGEQ